MLGRKLGLNTVIKRLSHVLEDRIGLNPALMSEKSWVRILNERMVVCGINDYQMYFQRVMTSPIEFQELIELIIVPESWFFRDRASIEFIARHLCKKWLESKKKKSFIILSLPCSSGEEPLSIAMALLEESIPASHFEIQGYDISKKLIAKAEMGIYGSNSFRGKDLAFRDRNFDKVDLEYQVHKNLKRAVKFVYGNLFDPLFYMSHKKIYDVIFCRNLFIYLNRNAQKKAFEIFKELLIPREGILVVSPAETELARNMGFEPLHYMRDCSFVLKRDVKIPKKQVLENQQLDIEEIPVELPKREKEDELLKEALKLADNGQFEEAVNLCLEFMKTHGPSAEGYFLLGLIQHATGHEEAAEDLFQKAIYLNPKHYEALVYLNLLAQKRGDEKQAELYRQRIENITT